MKPFIFIFSLFLFQISFGQIEHLEMDNNTIVRIDSMIIHGNERVKDIVIFGESRLKEGQEIPISALRKELLNSRRNLLNTSLFNDVEVLIYKWTDDNHVSLDFQVDERWYLYPTPIVELTGISFREWTDEFDRDLQRLTYGLSLQHYNLTGNADRLIANWRGGFQHQYALNYIVTGLDKQRNWGLGVQGSFIRNKGATIGATDNLFDSELFDEFVYEDKGIGVSISRRKEITRRHILSVGFRNTSIDQKILDYSPNYFVKDKTRQRYGVLNYTFFKENRDLAEYPLKGEYYFANATYNGLFDKDFETLRFTGNVNIYRPLTEKLYFSTGFHGRYTAKYNESFFALVNSRLNSDLKEVRGYGDYQLFPVSFGILKSELRYQVLDKKFEKVPLLPDQFRPLPLKIYPKIFFDTGKLVAADHDLDNPLNDEFLYSFGAGVDLVTIYNTPLTIDATINHNNETSINFGIGKSF